MKNLNDMKKDSEYKYERMFEYKFETVPVYLEIIPSLDGHTSIHINTIEEDRILFSYSDPPVTRLDALQKARQELTDKISQLISKHEATIKYLQDIEAEAEGIFEQVKKDYGESSDDA